jgi:hypothetical protein
VLLTWDASPAAKKYKAEFSDSSSFSRIVDTHLMSNTNYAPRLSQLGFLNGGLLYWRVAALDEDNNVGGWATGTFKLPRAMRVTVSGFLLKRKRGMIMVTAQTIKGKAIRRASVKVRGAGVRARPKRTRRNGTAKFRLRTRRTGNLTFTVSKRGYRTAKAVLPVR